MTTTDKGQRSRATLLELAIERFATLGYQATSLADICRAAGMSTTAVYAYFPNKEALFAAAIDADADGLIRDALGDVLAGEFSGDWATVLGNLLVALDSHPLARRVLAGEEGKSADRLLVLPAEAALRRGLADALAEGQRRGDIRDDVDAQQLAIGLETLVVSLLIAVLQTGGVADDERTAGVLAVLDAAIHAPIPKPRPRLGVAAAATRDPQRIRTASRGARDG